MRKKVKKPIKLQALIDQARAARKESAQSIGQGGNLQEHAGSEPLEPLEQQQQPLQSQQYGQQPNAATQQPNTASQQPKASTNNQEHELNQNIDQNIAILKSNYENCADIVFRFFHIKGKDKAALMYLEGLSNIAELNEQVLSRLIDNPSQQTSPQSAGLEANSIHAHTGPIPEPKIKTNQHEAYDGYLEQILSISNMNKVQTINEVIDQVSLGNPVILVDQQKVGFSLGLAQWEKRAIEEPTAENVIRGPREGFIESIGVNMALLRRKIRSPKFKTKQMEVGRLTKTNLIVAYIEGVADPTLITEVENRIKRIDIDGVLESGYIEDFIEDNPYSPFPQVLNTERTDVVSSYLLEGHVAILTDGTPFALVVPTTFYSLMQAAEDYYQRPMLSTIIRWLRFLFIVISLLLPSLYVAVLTYHHEMIPTSLLISMAASREPIPFPAVIEALSMEIMFEILREAGIRLPKQIGAAVSIVGALVIGQAAVEAGIVSAPMVMVVALTGIASFAIPRYNAGLALRMLRFPMLLLAGFLGLLGIMLGVIVIVIHLCTLRSFGVPYLSPIAPMKKDEMKDVFLRLPKWAQDVRPHLTGSYNKYRQAPNQKPEPAKGGD